MDMRIASVNVGAAETIAVGGQMKTTGIRKRPTDARVRINRSGVGTDAVVNTEYHGGADQAVYAYSEDDYRWWTAQSGRLVGAGSFGENLTIAGLPSDLYVGDRLLIGDTVLEATAPRIPCGTFAAHMQDPDFPIAFRRAERPGIYFRVLNEGDVIAGDFVTLVENPNREVSIVELFRFKYDPNPDSKALQRFLSAPISERTRTKVEKRLAALTY